MENDIKSQKSTKRQDMSEHYRWVSLRLKSGKVTRKEFKDYHKEMGFSEDLEADAWSKIRTAIESVLNSFDIKVEFRSEPEPGLYCPSAIAGALPENPNFRPIDDEVAKRHIGGVVANYLHRQPRDRAIVIGSGTACLHVGLMMRKLTETSGKLYTQNIWTTNPALATEWCRGATHPAKELHIPEAVLDLDQMRFSRMTPPKLNWRFSIAILGAHGCLLDNDGTAQLYSGWGPTAIDHQWFLDHVLFAVICCLPSAKLEVTEEGVSGAIFGPGPTSKITKFLVTDKQPSNTAKLASLDEAGWRIVIGDEDWDRPPGWWRGKPTRVKSDATADSLPSAAPLDDSADE